MDEMEMAALAEVRRAMQDPHAAVHVVQTLTHGRALQVMIKSRKIGPMFFPAEGGSLGDVMAMFGQMLDDDDDNDETTNDGETDART